MLTLVRRQWRSTTSVGPLLRPTYGTGIERRCFWVAYPPERVGLVLLEVRELRAVDGPVRYTIGLRGQLGARVGRGEAGEPGHPEVLVHDGRWWRTSLGEHRTKAAAIGQLLHAAYDCTRAQADKWAKQGWMPGAQPRPLFVGICSDQVYNPTTNGCEACGAIDLVRGRRPIWR